MSTLPLLSSGLLLLGAALLMLVVAERPLRRLPLTIALAAVLGHWLLELSLAAALLLGAILAPTDPVLASDVQIRSDQDREPVRLAITAEGGMNDGAALPAVMLAWACSVCTGWVPAGGTGGGPT